MSTGQPLFTVATITYNSGKWVSQAIESILCSSFTDFELLISDDCSTDDTWSIIQGYKDPRIRTWRNEQNIGEYPNRNKVLEAAAGKYILFVDGDDILYRDSLRNLSEYVQAFPEAGMLWGLNPQLFPFYVFPYLVHPKESIKLIYQTMIPISTIGFGEMLFKTEVLRSCGGMSEKYKIGDTYIKKKLAIITPVLFVPIGLIFWRQSDYQASKKIANGLDGFFERVSIDKEIINHLSFPLSGKEKDVIVRNIRIGVVKIFISSTMLKGHFYSFFVLAKKIELSWNDLPLLFKKGDYSYRPSPVLGEPLMNKYHFKHHVLKDS
ncbi:glycosyltransferase involved in cell wall biosynthesis [Lacibacter cauensis]|uniref:Glycosyltransferase involved in cell wall biosynthesis n=1 Tax=Lacibacter cauensis TaxID=510947 RepID=A0A562SJL6_9BACT|nr:glycosyltransferase family 2 protein [Lacibacter cauensis]TWI81402.1 glycosyltransferase involved in cell wall biosynthesis [Lacibacter cauensis]